MDGATALGTVSLVSGTATFPISTLSVGTHPITATYNGDASFLASTSTPPVIQVVNQTAITVTTLTSTPNPSSYGEAVQFDVTVTPIAGGGTPTGFVTLFSGANPLTTLTLDGTGSASYTTSDLPAGVLTIVALYSGDSQYSSSTATISQVVVPISTTTVITSSQNPSTFDEAVTFSATITSTTGPIPTGSVSFYNGATLIGTSLLNNLGVGNITYSNLLTGSHTINAIYNADPNFATSSDSLVQVVNTSPTDALVLTSSPNPSKQGDPVTFVASVSSAFGIPTGTVTFYDGLTSLGTAPLFNGLAIFNTTFLNIGTHQISIAYSGDTNFSASTSPNFEQIVESAVLNTTMTLSSSLNPAMLGDAVTFTAQVTSSTGTPTGSVTFFDGSNAIG